ncbi:MAG: FumA C-terminus/TtdB family hydratase beta subunit [Eubacteriales bacterium]|nr:FumA C-terminus/TtdB family hydratase beta subunit [Eubacteriales bacterium]
MALSLQSPFTQQVLDSLRAGDQVLLSGVVYTARDAAHARFCTALAAGEPLPVDLRGQTIFYAGPTPTPPGKASGAIGPTTSTRMDPYTPPLLAYGVKALIGKGQRSEEVKAALMQNGAAYFVAVGGCAASLAACVQSVEVLAYPDLGTESVKKLVIRDLPLTVAIDTRGEDFYREGQKRYLESVR